MEALRRNFSGEGNPTQNLEESERLNESLYYKSKREMYSQTFLTQFHKMFNIYEKEGEEISDEAKVRFLFRKVQHPGIRSSIDALKAPKTTGTTISYTMAANYLSTATSELPYYISKNARNVSGIQVGDGTKGGDGIYNGDGSMITGHTPNWKLLPFKYLKLAID